MKKRKKLAISYKYYKLINQGSRIIETQKSRQNLLSGAKTSRTHRIFSDYKNRRKKSVSPNTQSKCPFVNIFYGEIKRYNVATRVINLSSSK